MPSGPTGDERILIVDDEPQILKMHQQALDRLGYMVSARVSSLDSLEAFKTVPENDDLVIKYMAMRDMTGVRLARKI